MKLVPIYVDCTKETDNTALREKFAVKGLQLPSVADVVKRAAEADELKSEWANMLRHQLPELPAIGVYLDRLPGLLSCCALNSNALAYAKS